MFDECHELKSLTLMKSTPLRGHNIRLLNSCAATLEELNLSHQGITSMEGFNLPFLHTLILHDNQVDSMLGIEGLPHLQKLCLSRNRICKMEYLHHVGDLRELYLQANLIEYIDESVQTLTELQSLSLAGNKVREVIQIITSLFQFLTKLFFILIKGNGTNYIFIRSFCLSDSW